MLDNFFVKNIKTGPFCGFNRLFGMVNTDVGKGLFILAMKMQWRGNLKDLCKSPEPEFVNILRSQGIDSQPGGPV